MKLTQRQKIIVGIVIGLFILGVSLIIYFTTKKSTCTPNCTGKNCGDDDGCGGKCNDKCPGYRCETNGCIEGKPCEDGDSGCYPNQKCGGQCSLPGYHCVNSEGNNICTQRIPCTNEDKKCYPTNTCGGTCKPPGYRCVNSSGINICTEGKPCNGESECYPTNTCGGTCKNGYRCENNVCTEGKPCNGESGCYPNQKCGGTCKTPGGGLRFLKNTGNGKYFFDVDWSDFSLVKSTTKLLLREDIWNVYLNASSISHFFDMSQSSFKFKPDGSPVIPTDPYNTNIGSVEYLDIPGGYPELLITSDSLNYPNMSNSTRNTLYKEYYPIKFIGIIRPIFLRIYKLAEKEQSTVYYDLYLKQFYPLFYDYEPDLTPTYLGISLSGFYYGIDLCTMEKDGFTFNDKTPITKTNVDRFEVLSTEDKPAPFVMKYANSCLLDDIKGTPTLFKKVTIIPNSKQTVKLNTDSISFFSF